MVCLDLAVDICWPLPDRGVYNGLAATAAACLTRPEHTGSVWYFFGDTLCSKRVGSSSQARCRMRRGRTLLLVVSVACGKKEVAKTDPAATAAPPPPPPAPAALTEADVAGTWKGTATREGTDSVFSHWTQVCAAGTCKGTSEEMKGTTVSSTYTLSA